MFFFFSLSGQEKPNHPYSIKYYNLDGNELWRMNTWVSYNVTHRNLTIHKLGYFKLSRPVRDSLERDAIIRLSTQN